MHAFLNLYRICFVRQKSSVNPLSNDLCRVTTTLSLLVYHIFSRLFPFALKYFNKQINKIDITLDYSYPESEFRVICISFYIPHPSHPLPESHFSSSSHFSAESTSVSSHTPHSPSPASFSSRWSIAPSPLPTRLPRPNFASTFPAGFADSAAAWSAHSSTSALRPSSHRSASSQLPAVPAASLLSVLVAPESPPAAPPTPSRSSARLLARCWRAAVDSAARAASSPSSAAAGGLRMTLKSEAYS